MNAVRLGSRALFILVFATSGFGLLLRSPMRCICHIARRPLCVDLRNIFAPSSPRSTFRAKSCFLSCAERCFSMYSPLLSAFPRASDRREERAGPAQARRSYAAASGTPDCPHYAVSLAMSVSRCARSIDNRAWSQKHRLAKRRPTKKAKPPTWQRPWANGPTAPKRSASPGSPCHRWQRFAG